MSRARTAVMLVMALVASAFVLMPAPAQAVASANQPNVVNSTPQANTPDVNDGIVFSIGQVGNQVILGGDFTSVSPHGDPGTILTRNNILAFDATSGAIDTGFVPAVNGEVDTIEPGPAPNEVYIGGSFTTVDGATERAALLNTTTGAIVSTWKPSAINGPVRKIILNNGVLYIGGFFTSVGGVSHGGLIAVSPTTGKLLPNVNLAFTGHHNFGVQCIGSSCANGPVGIRSMDVDPSGHYLVAIGNFTSVGPTGGLALPRDQAVLIDLTGGTATVDPNWATDAYTAECFANAFDSYVRGVQFSPDGSYFVIVGTGGSGTNSDGTNSSCDTAARFETTGTGTDVRPTWIDYTGQDSFLSVAVAGDAVYVGGHQRWVNNSLGHDNPGPGAIPRPGIVALNPTSGMPLAWNPGRNPRGDGAYSLLATANGLFVGSDTDYIGNMAILHKKIAFFPLSGGEVLPPDTTPTLPGRVYTAGGFPSPGSSNVLYRIDAGGPTIGAIDNGPDWQGDTSDPSPYRNTGSNTASYTPVTNVDSTVPATTPSAIFNTERWDPGNDVGDGGNMHWAFPVPAGDKVDVRLYFANRYTGTSQVGQRIFNVNVDGQPFLTNFDIVAAAGDQTGTMRADTVTSDGEIDIDFSHVKENPLIDGIEIVQDSPPTTFPTPIYRINAGGSQINATDGAAANWLADNADTVGTGGPARTGGNVAGYVSPWNGARGASLPASAPSGLFSSERWGPQTYSYPVTPGTPLTVNLLMANNCSCTQSPGNRIFNVAIDGTNVLSNYDIVADVGNLVGEEKSFPITAPASGVVTISFTNGSADNALINGIEIDQTGPTPPPTVTNVDRFSYRHFDGTTAGAETSMSTGISWGSIRGAFMLNGELIYGKSDGNLYERTFDGSTFGAETELDPWNDPNWDNVQTGSGQTYQGTESTFGGEIPSLTSMFFTNDRLYYTVSGSPTMHWRWFESDDGAVGSDEFTVNDGENWSGISGAFLSGNTLYYADKSSGELFSVGWNGTQATGTPVLVDSNTDWASRGMFMLADVTTPNQPPVASFLATCSGSSTACTLDASASKDPDGSITNYAWNYGDGSPVDNHADATLFSHDFGTPGTYTVSLTVTDNDGASSTKTEQVTAGTVTPVPTFKGAVSVCGTGGTCGPSTTTTANVPSTTAAGDELLMFVSWPTNTIAATVPNGWTLLGKVSSAALESDVYYRYATPSDVGSTVTVSFATHTKNSVTLADYSGVDLSTIEASASNSDSNTANHTTPTVNATVGGSLGIQYWADKSGTTTAWTMPSGVTTDATFLDTGASYVTSVLAHSTALVNAGSYGGLTAMETNPTNTPSGKGTEWTIVLAPASTAPNQPPNAAFTPTCNGLTCKFDAGASNDPDGSIASYAWDFGDTVGTATGVSPSYTYTAAGTYNVKLTVTDNDGATGSVTIQVMVAPSTAKQISNVVSNTFDGNSTKPSVSVPPATSGIAAGDTMLLFASYASGTATATTPPGWTLALSKTTSSMTSLVYEKTVAAGDIGSPVTVALSATEKTSLVLTDYNNVSATPIEASAAATSTGTSHATPALSGLSTGTWVVSYWTDKSTTTAQWKITSAATQRAVVYGTLGGAVSGLLADSGAPVSVSYSGQTATTDASSGSAVQWSIALAPAT